MVRKPSDNGEPGSAGTTMSTPSAGERTGNLPSSRPVGYASETENLKPVGRTSTLSDVPGARVEVYPFGWSRLEIRRFIGLTITAIVSCTFLYYVQSILPPFLIAFFLAALFEPTLRELEKHGRGRVRAILTLYLAGFCLVTLAGFIIIPRVVSEARDINSNLSVYTNEIQLSADKFIREHHVLLAKAGIPERNLSQLMNKKAAPLNALMGRTLTGVTGAIEGLASRALWLVIIPLTAFFFMRDYPVLRARIITQFPDQYHERIDIMSREVMDVFSAYLRGLGKICSLYAVVATGLYWMLGLDYALVLGIFAGIFYAVPYVGQLFTAVATGLIAYQATNHTVLLFIHLNLPHNSLVYTLGVVITALIAQNIFDQILYPRIVGGSVGLHPVASIFALMSGATLFGIWGMLFAVPVAASLQIIILYFFPKIRKMPAPELVNAEEKTRAASAS
jgi:predicted PurR-regulated permease PerM